MQILFFSADLDNVDATDIPACKYHKNPVEIKKI